MLGHIPFDFDSFDSLVHPPVQGYILINKFLMGASWWYYFAYHWEN